MGTKDGTKFWWLPWFPAKSSEMIAIVRHCKGQHGILIFSCLLFVLFEKTNPDIFVWFLSLCYTVVGFGIYCPKILCIQKIAEIGYFTIKNITNTHKKFLLNCESWQIFALISLLDGFFSNKIHAYRYSSKLSVWKISRPYLFFVLGAIKSPVKIKIIFLY